MGLLSLVGVVLLVSVGLAVLAVPPLALVVLTGLGAAAGAALQRSLLPWPILHRHSVLAGSLCAIVLIGLVGSLGVSGAAIFGLLVVGALPLLRAQDGPRQGESVAVHPSVIKAPVSPEPLTPVNPGDELDESGDESDEPLAAVVAGWTGEELCWAWRCSFSRVQRAGDAAELARVARERRSYLDEIERRDPHGFATWMREGARAASDPRRYLRLER